MHDSLLPGSHKKGRAPLGRRPHACLRKGRGGALHHDSSTTPRLCPQPHARTQEAALACTTPTGVMYVSGKSAAAPDLLLCFGPFAKRLTYSCPCFRQQEQAVVAGELALVTPTESTQTQEGGQAQNSAGSELGAAPKQQSSLVSNSADLTTPDGTSQTAHLETHGSRSAETSDAQSARDSSTATNVSTKDSLQEKDFPEKTKAFLERQSVSLERIKRRVNTLKKDSSANSTDVDKGE